MGRRVIPGLGSAVADWFAYGYALQTCKGRAETFGKGDVRGVIAVDAATNAKEGGSLIPTLAFGIPGSSTLALIFGGLVIVGITPGREILTTRLDITFSIIWLLIIGSILTTILCLMFTRQLAMATMLRPSILVPLFWSLAFTSAALPIPTAWMTRLRDGGLLGSSAISCGRVVAATPLVARGGAWASGRDFLWTSYQIAGVWFLMQPGSYHTRRAGTCDHGLSYLSAEKNESAKEGNPGRA